MNEQSHDMHQVGDGPIWCCSRCGDSVRLVKGDRPMEKRCHGSYDEMVEHYWPFRPRHDPDGA